MSITGYKIFDANWQCRGVQYAVGETTRHDGEVIPCKSGLHFCAAAIDCAQYYPVTPQNKFAEVTADAVIKRDDKMVTAELTVTREISYEEFCELTTGTVIKYLDGEKCESQYRRGLLHGVCKSWYRDGTPRDETNYQNGRRHGSYKSWWPNGQLAEQSNYTYNELNGRQTTWYDDGKRRTDREYEMGQRMGNCRSWYKSGKMQEDSVYTGNYLNGVFESWYESGQQEYKAAYYMGARHGPYKHWSETGELITSECYHSGTKI